MGVHDNYFATIVTSAPSEEILPRSWKLLGVLGLIGAVVVGIGEFLVHYNPAGFGEGGFAFFGGVSDSAIIRGHFLMIAALPLYVFGYLHLYLGFRPGGPYREFAASARHS